VPSDKRQRQRENSRAREQAAIAAQARRKRRNQGVAVVVGAIVVVALLFLFGPLGGSDDNSPKKKTAAVTTTTKKSTATTAANVGDPNSCPPAEGTPTAYRSFPSAPKMCIDVNKKYDALVKTDAGEFTMQLDPKVAPKTVNSFVFLARNHFYDGVIYHRVIPGFMVQGGDPEGSGGGGPGYSIPDEFSANHKFAVGDVAMAKTSAANSGGSQFFVVTGPQGESLPPQYTWFGTVTKGMDVVKKIEGDGNADLSSNGVPPKVTHKMISVTITEE